MRNFYIFIIMTIFIINSDILYAQVEYFNGGSICNDEEWVLVFEDEFEGDELNTDNWYTYNPYNDAKDGTCDECRTHFYDDDNAVYLDKNVNVVNGHAELLVIKEDVQFGSKNKVFPFSKAELYSKREYTNYAKFEARIKMSANPKFQKNFWLWGWQNEIDIFETSEPNKYMITIHNWGNPPYPDDLDGDHAACSTFILHNYNFGDFHTYSVEYEKYFTKFYIDDTLRLTYKRYPASSSCDLTAGYYQVEPCYPNEYSPNFDNEPLRLIISTDPQKGLSGDDFNSSDFPYYMVIDYVRVYNKCGFYNELVVNEGEEMTITGTHEYSNIFVHKNGVLNIENADIKMNYMSRINVTSFAQLNISNSTITSTCSDKWDGIYGWWESEINLDDDTYIQNAKKAVTLYNGSHAELTNSTIENCDIGFLLEDIHHDCTITNVDFKNNITAISSENSDSVTISFSKFSDNDYGITSFDSFLDISEGNLFIDNNTYDIKIDGTYTTISGSYIGKQDGLKNRFLNYSTYYGILCRGSDHPVKVQIKNNIFKNERWPVAIAGTNDVLVANNEFQQNDLGVSFMSTGGNYNQLLCNIYTDNSASENVFGFDNKHTTFLGNQFSNLTGTSWYNFLLIGGQPEIAKHIGNSHNPAENCFSHNNFTIDIETYNYDNVSFDYFYHDNGQSDNCEEPKNQGNYNAFRTSNLGNNCGGHYGPFNKIDPDGDGDDGIDTTIIACCLPDILDSVDFWIDIVLEDGGDNPKTIEVEGTDDITPELQESEEILDQWINFGIYAALETENYDFGDQLLNPLVTLRWQKRLYGLKVRQRKYEEARQILNSLPQKNQEHINFKTVQDINLKRFESIESGIWTIDAEDIATLKSIAQSSYPSKGYANSLYTRLTGELLPENLPDIPEKLEERKPSDEADNNGMTKQIIYPNPATNELNINLGNDTESLIVEIYNTDGKKVIYKKISSSQGKIDISDVQSGVYFVNIMKDNGEAITKKVFIK